MIGALIPLALTVAALAPDQPCDVALAFVQTMVEEAGGKKIVFSDRPETLLSIPTRSEWYDEAAKRNVPAPAQGLVDRVSSISAVAACPSVRVWLDKRGIAYGASAVDAAVKSVPLGNFNRYYDASILGLSLPVISADHLEAVLVTSRVAGPLAGGGAMLHLRRAPDGTWKQASMTGLWVS